MVCSLLNILYNKGIMSWRLEYCLDVRTAEQLKTHAMI